MAPFDNDHRGFFKVKPVIREYLANWSVAESVPVIGMSMNMHVFKSMCHIEYLHCICICRIYIDNDNDKWGHIWRQ